MKQRFLLLEYAALAAVIVLALAVRFIGLRWGLPNESHYFSYHPDEAPILIPVSRMLTEAEWNPHFFNYGTLYLHIVGVLATSATGLGLVPAEQAWGAIHLIARLITALMGAATVLIVYLIARRSMPVAGAMASAAFMAVLPMHALHSHFATVDVPATFFVALAALAMIHLSEEARLVHYVLAAICIGLAAATKYSMVLAVVPLVFVHFMAKPARYHRAPPIGYLALGLIGSALTFLIVCPYVFSTSSGALGLNPEFVRDVTFEMKHMREGGTFAFVNTGAGWGYHFLRTLPCGLGMPLMLLSLAGIVVAAVAHRSAGMVSLLWCIPYFLVTGSGQEKFLRYAIPLSPFVALLAAEMLSAMAGASGDRRRWGAAAAIGAAVFAPTLWYCFENVAVLARTDARDQAAQWLRPRLAGKTLGLVSTPWYFTPPVAPYNGGVRSEPAHNQWMREKADFRIVVTGWNPDALKSGRPGFFVVSDAEYADPVRLKMKGAPDLMIALNERYRENIAFENRPGALILGRAKEFAPPDWLYAWPRIIIYSGWR